MKMKLREVNKNLNALANMGGMIYPAKMSFAISRNIEILQRESERINNEREKLCKDYAEKDENGDCVMVEGIINGQTVKKYKMTDEKQAEFEAEYDDLLNEETDLDIRTVKQEVVERCEEVERYSVPTVAHIVGMAFMIEEE